MKKRQGMKKNKKYIYAHKTMVVGFIIVATALIVGLTLLFWYQSRLQLREITLSKKSAQPESSKPPLKVNKDETAKNIEKLKSQYTDKCMLVFFYDGYDSQEEALRFIAVMKNALELVEPFSSASNIETKIFTTPGQKCHLKKTVKTLLECDKSLIESFNRLGVEHFKLVVISPLNFVPSAKVARGKNSAIYMPTYQGSLTREELTRFVGRFFIHELGHSLGLRDEYSRDRPKEAIIDEQAANSLSSNVAYQPAKPNCAPDEGTAKKWWGEYLGVFENIGVFPGCAGRTTYFFPEESTIMSDNPAKEGFGKVSEDYLRGALDCFYGNKGEITFPAGQVATYSATLSTCSAFKSEFPNFWNE